MIFMQSALPGQFSPKRSLPGSIHSPRARLSRSKSIDPSANTSGNVLARAAFSSSRFSAATSIDVSSIFSTSLISPDPSFDFKPDGEQLFVCHCLPQPCFHLVQKTILLNLNLLRGRVVSAPCLFSLRLQFARLTLEH